MSSDSTLFIRVHQVGYLPDAPKVAVACALDSNEPIMDGTANLTWLLSALAPRQR